MLQMMRHCYARAVELFAYPADRHTPSVVALLRLIAPAFGIFLVAPLIDRFELLRPVKRWFGATPLRFRFWLVFVHWPFANFRRILIAVLVPGRPTCLHVTLGLGPSPTAMLLRKAPARRSNVRTRLCVLSDTHGQHALYIIPKCELLVHCGDLMTEDRGVRGPDGGNGALARLEEFGHWLGSQPCEAAIVIGGNHDAIFEDLGAERVRELLCHGASRADPLAKVYYLCNEGADVKGLRVFGTPLNAANSKTSQNIAFQPAYGAQTGDDDPKLRAASQIPPGGLDILISHGPPAGVLDVGLGSPLLAEMAFRERPALHLFGHQHLAYGVAFDPTVGTLFVNAASCDGLMAPLHPPVVIDAYTRFFFSFLFLPRLFIVMAAFALLPHCILSPLRTSASKPSHGPILML